MIGVIGLQERGLEIWEEPYPWANLEELSIESVESDFEALSLVPNGYAAIVKAYGQPMSKGGLNKSWYDANIISVKLPYAMRIAWDTSKIAKTATVHKLVADSFAKTLTDVFNYARQQVKKKTPDKDTAFYDEATMTYLKKYGLDLYGGAFNFRMKRGSNQLSMHSWGCACDINPSANAMGTKGNMPDWFVKIWEANGWVWGGRWNGSNKDPMHIQLAKGY